MDGWKKQEAGWYTHPKQGGITHEINGWHVWWGESPVGGPYKTLRKAKVIAKVHWLERNQSEVIGG